MPVKYWSKLFANQTGKAVKNSMYMFFEDEIYFLLHGLLTTINSRR